MKKLLLVLTFLLTLSLGACNNAPEDFVSQEEYNLLEERVLALEEELGSLVVTRGLNGQVDYYVNGEQYFLSLSSFEMMVTEKDYLDKTKFPSYIFDLDGEYIDVNELGNLLSQKYLGIDSTTTIGFQYKIKLEQPENMSTSEYMARICMMIVELSEYDFYTIDSPELYIEFVAGGSQYMKVRMSLLVTDKYILHPAIFWNELMDTRLVGISVPPVVVEEFYDNFIIEETFTGYVLDYN